MTYSELPWRPFLGDQAWSWTTLRRGNVFITFTNVFFNFYLNVFYIYAIWHKYSKTTEVGCQRGANTYQCSLPLQLKWYNTVIQMHSEHKKKKEKTDRKAWVATMMRQTGATISDKYSIRLQMCSDWEARRSRRNEAILGSTLMTQLNNVRFPTAHLQRSTNR